MNIEDFIGYIGAGLITVCLVPQVYTTYKTKTVEGLSLYFVILQILSSICYVVYGLYEQTLPIIISNGATIFFSIILITLYCRYKEFKTKKLSLDEVANSEKSLKYLYNPIEPFT